MLCVYINDKQFFHKISFLGIHVLFVYRHNVQFRQRTICLKTGKDTCRG